jgi:predicted RNA binding protein with dsRBD fold (UPF0201 family)
MTSREGMDDEDMDALEVASAPPAVHDLMLEVSAPVHPTEDESAVRRSINNLFPGVTLERRDGTLEGSGTGPLALARLRRRLREMRIRDTARSQLSKGTFEGSIRITLNKQSAFARVPNFSTGGAPLGDIDVTLRAGDLPSLIEWMCELDKV